MINDYKIVNKDGSQILYLYINYEYEFASFFNDKKIKNIKNHIVDFITNKKIDFNGNTVILVLNGVIICSIFLGNINNNIENQNNLYKYVASPKEIFINKKNNSINDNSNNIDNNVNEVTIAIPENIEQKTSDIEITNKSVINNNSEIIKEDNQLINKEANINKNSSNIVRQVEEQEITQINEEIKYEKMVNVIRSNGTIISIPLEEYIIGVVGAEMPASFNLEALKAQAIIARTYALKRIEEGKIISDTTINQVYKDNNELREIWKNDFDIYYNKITNAVESTKGEVIKYNGKYIDSVYHSTSNGMTEDPLFVWGYIIPYLKSVNSTWDLNASSYLRTISLSTDELNMKLETEINNNTPINILDRSPSNRINYIQIGNKIINGVDLYNLLGLRSRDFDIAIEEDIVNITTRGYGHGVGLSQYGANGMAKEGYNYRQIINHYYNNVDIVKEDL